MQLGGRLGFFGTRVGPPGTPQRGDCKMPGQFARDQESFTEECERKGNTGHTPSFPIYLGVLTNLAHAVQTLEGASDFYRYGDRKSAQKCRIKRLGEAGFAGACSRQMTTCL